MWKRFVSLLLAACLLIGMLPGGLLPAQAVQEESTEYARGAFIHWGENGEYQWNYWYDPESKEIWIDGDALPEGVSFDEGLLTLRNASLYQISFDRWGDLPVKVVVEGENTVSGIHDSEYDSALRFYACYDVTIEGGGALYLESSRVPLETCTTLPDTAICREDSTFLIRDVKIEAFNNYADSVFNADTAWSCSAMSYQGNLTIDNAELRLRGHNGFNGSGSLTLKGGTKIDADGFNVGCRPYEDSPENDQYYRSTILIEDAQLDISVHRNKCEWDYFVFEIGPGCDLVVREGADITVDCSQTDLDLTALLIHDDYTNGAGPATMTMEGGRLHVISAPLENVGGICIGNRATWDQTGGEVILDALHPNARFALWNDGAVMNLYGGSVTVRGTCLGIDESAHWNQYGGDVRIERTTENDNGIWLGRYSSFTMTDGSMTVVNDCDELQNGPVDDYIWTHGILNDAASEVTLAGGSFVTEGDWLTGAGFQGPVTVTGGSHSINGIRVGTSLGNGCTMTMVSGSLETCGGDWAMEVGNGCGLNMLGGTLTCLEQAMVFWHGGYGRFLGGETILEGDDGIILGHDQDGFLSYGEGICAAYDDGTAAELTWREEDGWQVMESDGRRATIKAQSAAASETKILLSLNDPDRVTAGVNAGVKMICLLPESEGSVDVTMPQGAVLIENSVYCNGKPIGYTLTEAGFSVTVGSGSLVTFTIRPSHTGSAVLKASYGSYETEAEIIASAYSLTVPSIVNSRSFPLHGTAAAGAKLVFCCGGEELQEVQVSSLGTWSTEITLPGQGYHHIYAILYAPDGAAITVTEPYRVLYDPNGIVAESLTISNWIHGNSMLDPHVQAETVIDYETGKTSPGYYIYWPDLPEFTLTAKFKDGRGTPETIYNVRVLATDRHGKSVTVPMEYDPQTDTWVGKQDFCCDGTITPERFQLEYRCYDEYPGLNEPDWIPDHLPEPKEMDSSDGAAVLVTEHDGRYTVMLSKGAKVESLRDGIGQDVAYVVEDDALTFPVEDGECYVVTLENGSFAEHPGVMKLTVSVAGGKRGDYRYQDNVQPVSPDVLKERTETTFTAAGGYQVDDVLMVDGIEALVITGIEGTTYTYEYAALDQIYAYLDVSGIDSSRPIEAQWDREALLKEFRESAAFKKYMKSLEKTLNAWEESKEYEFELGDVEANIELTYGYRDDGTIYVNPVFGIKTTMTTKLPWEGELETEVSAELGYLVEENLNYRIRSRNDDQDVQSYMLFTDETVTTEINLGVSVGEDPNENEEYFSDFEQMMEELKSNFLEELEEDEEESFNPLKDVKLQIPTPIPAVTVFISPGMEVEWTFFGEMETNATMVNKSTKGILITHLGRDYLGDWRDWSVTTFHEKEDPEAELTTTMHLSASVGLMLRVDLGVMVAQCVDLGLYAEAGPKITVGGHGYFAIRSDGSGSSSAELLAALILEAEIGASAGISLKKLPIKLPRWEQEIYSAAVPLAEIGERIMPWEYAVIEEEKIQVPSVCDLKRYIDLNLKCQYFNVDGSITDGKQRMDADKYKFELLWSGGRVNVASNGTTTVIDTEKEFDFRVKVTYTGSSEDYKIWKIVELHYSPASLTILKSAEEAPPTAGFEIINLTNPYDPVRYASTNESGVVTIELAAGCEYEVHEISPPPKNVPVDPLKFVFVGGEATVAFENKKREEPEPELPPAPIIPPIGDPSGYVFEGIESNRLEGVTAELYVADDEHGANTKLWDAAPYDQLNPLLTDPQGQYQWMVPDGWWQVRWSLEGYESAESEWMVVPPIRTGVNQNLVSGAPAKMTVRYSQEERTLAMIFSRPVVVGSVMDIVVTVDGQRYGGWLDPADSAWSVTGDPLDSRICATAFRVNLPEEAVILGKEVSVSISDATTYYGTSCGPQSVQTVVPEAMKYRVSVTRGTGGGYYAPGETVTVRAYDFDCHPFDNWGCWGIELEDNRRAEFSFRMPENEVFLEAWYSGELVHDYVARVTEPGCETEGYTTHTCSRCGDSYIDTFSDPLGHDWKGLECGRCGAVRENPFADVPEGSFYYESVMWAVKNGITNGTSETTFGPGDQCMRAHVVTFLWRSAGSPEPKTDRNPFVDVTVKDFYYKAVLWAVENGITNGVDATHFGPFAFCNRAQVVTFLYRSLGSPQIGSTKNPFADVPQDQWYTAPVLWAVENGVTNGLSANQFGPNSICNRAQIVTFLYRAFNP